MKNLKNKKRLVEKFKQKWQIIKTIEDAEILKMSIAEKFHQLVSIIRLAKGLHMNLTNDKETAKVRSRWVFLKRMV